MPSVRVHCAISKKRTGDEFKELHQWIDEPRKYLGYNHRIERHSYNSAYENFIRKNWNNKGVVEWLFHIALDNLDTAFKKSKSVYKDKTYNFLSFGLTNTKYIHCESKKLNDADLNAEFPDED